VRAFFIRPHADECDDTQITVFKALYVTYQSVEDFRARTDKLRCNPTYHGRARYDFAWFNVEGMQFARLEGLFRCHLPSGVTRDVLLVQGFKDTRWRPQTFWDGCKVVEKGPSRFVLPDYVVRGALLVDTELGRPNSQRFFVDDTVDNDMFLRMGN
jgi:hypothetical protein